MFRKQARSMLLFACLVAAALIAQAQAPAGGTPAPGRGGQASPVVVSPEVLPDRRVIVRLYAPQAREVSVGLNGSVALKKGNDGVWEATVGPLDPGAYRYGFTVDGASVTDPRNIETERMQVVTRSILHVPGAAFMDTRNVPHGAVSVVTYYSTVLKKFRRFHVYMPPGYEANQQKYPVLYLLHGANESDDSWSTVGRAGFILDNLIADGKAVPMIVVMPNGHTTQTPPNVGAATVTPPPGAGQRPADYVDFPNEFAADILPYVESHYRVLADRPHRAIAGLSMGGSQTLNIAFAHLDQFSAIGIFSSGILGGGNPIDWEKSHAAALDDPKLKKGLKTVWLSTGTDDAVIANSRSVVELLSKHAFTPVFRESTGAHTWINWRNYLHEFAPQLFR